MLQSNLRRYLKHGMLPQLRVFEAVSRHGNFTRAAEELYMAQPTVSVQIKKLTETVGLPLFEHVGKRVYPTAAGRELYTACQAILKALSDVEVAFSDIRGLDSGSLRIATSSAGKYLAPRLLAEFVKAYPGVAVSLRWTAASRCCSALEKTSTIFTSSGTCPMTTMSWCSAWRLIPCSC